MYNNFYVIGLLWEFNEMFVEVWGIVFVLFVGWNKKGFFLVKYCKVFFFYWFNKVGIIVLIWNEEFKILRGYIIV